MLLSLLVFSAALATWAAPEASTPLPCDPNKGRFRNDPFCNEKLPIPTRVKDFISRISKEDKLGQFANGAKAMPSVDTPGYQWWSEALHGVAGSPGVHFGGNIPSATSFPQVCLTGATFNRTLYAEIGKVISTEARAMNNEGRAGLTFWTPNINIYRDPRWGRGQETPGEDPFATSEYVASYLPGLQLDPKEGPKRLKVSSCCKHYAAYDLENWHGVDRHHFNAVCTKQDLADTFFPAFESCVTRGKGSGIMCSYNEVNGVPSCADKAILNDQARKAWGFEGYITSDCGAVSNVIHTHHYTNTSDATVKDTLTAGMDIDCGGYIDSNIKKALDDNAISMDDVDASLFNLFSVQFRLGMFDNPANIPWKKYGPKDVNTPANQALALEAAQQGIVLLKNSKGNNALPYNTQTQDFVGVIGPSANATRTMQGNYYGHAPYLISPLEGISKYTKTMYSQGCTIGGTSTKGFADALKVARQVNTVVMVMGLDQGQEREGHDRDIISFPGVQAQFIREVAAAAAGKPVTLVMMNGGPVDLTEQKANENITSIIWVGYPGQSGGQAIADVIFGTVGPSGRLPHTVYPAEYVKQVSMFDMNMRPGKDNPGRTHRFYTGTPAYSFGDGLLYTTVSYESLDVSVRSLTASKINSDLKMYKDAPGNAPTLATATFSIKNTGKRLDPYTGLLFAMPPAAGTGGRPKQSLVGFDKVWLRPGKTVQVVMDLNAFSFGLANTDGEFEAVKGIWSLKVEDKFASVNVM